MKRNFYLACILSALGWLIATPVMAAEAISNYGYETPSGVGYADGSAGFGFTPLANISVTSLGYSQSGLDTNYPAFQVSLWNSTGELLSTALITNTDSTFNQSYYQTVSPRTLYAGVTYFIGAVDLDYGVWLGDVDTNAVFSVSPDITYLGTAIGTNIWEGIQPDTTNNLLIGPNFQFAVVPQLTITFSGINVILTWPTNAAGFTLQSTTNLSPAAWSPDSPLPVVVNGQYTVTNAISGTQQFYELSQIAIPPGMALIPAGSFTIGDTLDGESDAIPTISVYVSVFYMDMNTVSLSQWESVYNWATNAGYGFDHSGSGKAANHPVQTVDWYDCVKWSNARSQLAGLTPVYYTDTNLTQVYTNGDTDAAYPNWSANGYRLPTEAEWEKAARGGLSGQRFPWGDTISESQANYNGDTGYGGYDLGPTGYNTNFDTGGYPYTSSVGYFASNGYGLYDMAGNVFDWCWDWYAPPPYPAGSAYLGGTDPRGPGSSPDDARVLRNGGWNYGAFSSRCANRSGPFGYGVPSNAITYIGFRCVRGH